ncbi:SDR family oxidoreductase [Devriesea agamarum]|uniref:SDR family oxidoreductase n=1 Tax=Devriesea agamarum TaxID=472569 RepID=UPI00071E2977|nr:SDR family oxidoreductase [Devriesea agamarum]
MKTALITGATRGIGRAIADDLSKDHNLILGGRQQNALQELAKEYPGSQLLCADLTDDKALAQAMETLELPDGLDVLVLSAGRLGFGEVQELNATQWREVLDTNVVACADLTKLLLPHLRRAQGTVIAINSGAGFTASAGTSSYAASKFALRAMMDALRAEERAHGVRVTSIHPGRVDTDMQRELVACEQAEYEAERYLRPESVAQAVGLAARMSPEASIDSMSIRPRY